MIFSTAYLARSFLIIEVEGSTMKSKTNWTKSPKCVYNPVELREAGGAGGRAHLAGSQIRLWRDGATE